MKKEIDQILYGKKKLRKEEQAGDVYYFTDKLEYERALRDYNYNNLRVLPGGRKLEASARMWRKRCQR